MASNLHPGISVHHIEVGDGIAGALVVVVSMIIFLVGVPALWTFLGGAVVLGLAVAGSIRLIHRFASAPAPKLFPR
jgi:hypothetical protein